MPQNPEPLTVHTQHMASGDVFTGKMVNGKRHGSGNYQWFSEDSKMGDCYDGDWKNDQRHGEGIKRLI